MSSLYPLFSLSRLTNIWILKSGPVSETIKTVFPCSGILYLCFKSLGLGITSVLLNPFKMVATYPFFFFLLSKNPTDTRFPLLIETVWLIPTNFPFKLETCSNRIPPFLYRRYIHEVAPIYWFGLTLDSCPEKWINTFSSSSIVDYLGYQRMSKPRAPSLL